VDRYLAFGVIVFECVGQGGRDPLTAPPPCPYIARIRSTLTGPAMMAASLYIILINCLASNSLIA
jgi:hypothetical protein